MSSSGTVASRRPTSRPLYSPSVAAGRTPISIEKLSASPSAGGSPRSSFGSPTGLMPEVSIASRYQSTSVSRIASSSTASRPMRWMTSAGGTLPLRKPGIFMLRPRSRAFCSTRRRTSSAGTWASTRTRDSGSSVTEVVTVAGIAVTIACRPVSGSAAKHAHRLETWWWTGPAGHLVAGLLDWLQAVGVWLAHLARRRASGALRRRSR